MAEQVSLKEKTEESSSSPSVEQTGEVLDAKLLCLLCEEVYPETENGAKNPMLAHLLSEHKLIIGDVDKIANFPKYAKYWRKRFFEEKVKINDYCVVINTNTATEDIAPQEKFFLLTSFLPEDRELRENLQKEKLIAILDEQLQERKDKSFSRKCLFCKVNFHGNRSQLFLHMAKDHSFNIGNPDNIIHVNEFLTLLQSKLDAFTCLFCEKDFKDWVTLKDHMRKKSHKRIDPKNKEYDKFYLINYLDPGKDWKEVQMEPEYEKELNENNDENSVVEWDDWIEDHPSNVYCLFCPDTTKEISETLDHMNVVHNFNLNEVKEKLNLNFYHQVKFVNFIRKQIYEIKCPHCLKGFECKDDLKIHLENENHCRLPVEQSTWDQALYYFPTYEDDLLLCFLEDGEDDNNMNSHIE